MDSERAISKLTRTTAASANGARMDRGGGAFSGPRSQIMSKNTPFGAQSVVNNVTKPRSQMNDQGKHMKTAGEVLNYPYSFEQGDRDADTVNLSNKLAK